MSWFYHKTKEILSENGFDVYLENQHTEPGDIFCRGGCDAIIIPRNDSNTYYTCEIKSIDEDPKAWFTETNNNALNHIRRFWKNNKIDDPENSTAYAYGIIITGQLEQYFIRRSLRLNKKVHKKDYVRNAQTTQKRLLRERDRKRGLIFDRYYENDMITIATKIGLSYQSIFRQEEGNAALCFWSFNKPDVLNSIPWFE